MLYDVFRKFFPCCFTKQNEVLESSPNKDLINYQLNDPTTPELIINIPVPAKNTGMNINVHGYDVKNLGEYGSDANRAANVYATLVHSMNHFCGHRTDIKNWAATKTLQVHPKAGKQLNAFYDRRNLKFFYEMDDVAKTVVYTANSVDVVAHELGHALLDAMRPDFWSSQALEIWAFHEAFGDINAIVTVMLHDEILHHALRETGGNMRNHNVISRLAEEMGNAIYNLTGGRGNFAPGALRNAINDFSYIPAERLPYDTDNDKLGGECHNFGRLMVSAWYDALINIYEYERNTKGVAPVEALKNARNSAYYYLVHGLKVAPNTPRFYNAIAQAMVNVASMAGSEHAGLIESAFVGRKILQNNRGVSVMSLSKDTLTALYNQGTAVVDGINGKAIRSERNLTIRLSDKLGIGALAHNPLYNCEIEVAADMYYCLNTEGDLTHHIQANDTDIVNAAVYCVNKIQENGLLTGNDPVFEIVDNKLVRKHVVCRCGC